MNNKFSATPQSPTADTENPYDMIDVFYDRYGPARSQRHLWELLTTAFSSQDIDFWSRLDRSNAVHFCHSLSDLLNATRLIHEQQKKCS